MNFSRVIYYEQTKTITKQAAVIILSMNISIRLNENSETFNVKAKKNNLGHVLQLPL